MAIFYPYYCLRAAFSSRLNEDLYHNRWVLNSADPATDYYKFKEKFFGRFGQGSGSSKVSFEEKIQDFEVYV